VELAHPLPLTTLLDVAHLQAMPGIKFTVPIPYVSNFEGTYAIVTLLKTGHSNLQIVLDLL
jgi:hypothetical protein